MTTAVIEQVLAYRYNDIFELFSERGFWGTLKRSFFLKSELRKLFIDSRAHIEEHEEQLKTLHPGVSNSEFSGIKKCFTTLSEGIGSLIQKFEGSDILFRTLYKPEIHELKQIYDKLEDLLENVNLSLDPTFRRSIEHALSELPSDVSTKAKDELNAFLRDS